MQELLSVFLVIVLLIVGLALLVFVSFIFKFFFLWLQAFSSGAPVGWLDLIGMAFRKVDAGVIVTGRITAVKAGLNLSSEALEAHYLARGNVRNVVRSLIAATRASIPLTFQRAAAIDLAGRDVLEAVQTSVNPKVIDCPNPASGRETIDAVAKDGIQLKVKARVTVRTNLDRLVGGATEDTIVARVGEGIVTTIGSSNTYKEVLEKPDIISKKVLEKGLDTGTAFEILSIDIADVDVGENIGAKLQTDQAETDKRVAQAKAEERRAMAIALEQEMVAQSQSNHAQVVLAEAEIPKAIAESFRAGQMSLMDYYTLRNVMADTTMRNAIAGESDSGFRM